MMFDQFSDFPTYNIKAVTHKTGVSAPTLRAWERRYNVLTPSRSDGNYRMYSERDIAVLQWLSERIREGLSISGAVALLDQQRRNRRPPPAAAGADAPAGIRPMGDGVLTFDALADRLHQALVRMDESQARQVLAEAQSMFTIEEICVKVVTPTMVRIGDDWHHRLISTVNEHFATNFSLGRLYIWLNAQETVDGPLALVGCSQGERHELGALMMALMLRRKGLNARYIGADVPSEELMQTIWMLKPRVVVLSAMMQESSQVVNRLAPIAGAHPYTQFVVGGTAFRDPTKFQARSFPPNMQVLGNDMAAGIELIQSLLKSPVVN